MDIYQQEKEIQDKVSSAYDSVYGSLIAYDSRWGLLCDYVEHYCDQSSVILEIGCGTASFLKHMKQRGYQNLIGCDLSPETILEARKKVHGVRLDVANMISLPYEPCSIDTAVFMGSLHHLPLSDVEKAISEAKRVLREGGIMIIADANKDFDSFKSGFLIRVLRKIFNIKNSRIRKKTWQFDPHDSSNYTAEHTHKSKIDYINSTMSSGDLSLIDETLNEHFVVQFEGCLFKDKIIDRLFYKLLSFLDRILPLLPQSQLLITFRKNFTQS